jgi:dolichol-phosphate mannosyltransferase
LNTAVRQGYKVVEVPFHFVDREVGESKLGTEYIKNTLSYILRVRVKDVITNRVFKFVAVGGFGAMVQFLTLSLLRGILPYQLAFFGAIETSVLSNFALNNVWTFSDRKLEIGQLPAKFVQFNFASAGSIIIQQAIALIGERFIGTEHVLFVVPLLRIAIDTGTMFAVVGIFIGMFWNFFAYNAFIWKKK